MVLYLEALMGGLSEEGENAFGGALFITIYALVCKIPGVLTNFEARIRVLMKIKRYFAPLSKVWSVFFVADTVR